MCIVDVFGRLNLSSQLPESSATWAREATAAPPSQWSLRELNGALNASAPASSATDERADRSTLEGLFRAAIEKRLFDVIPLWLVLCAALVLLVGLVVAHVFFLLRCCRDRRRKAAERSRKSLENGSARRSKKPGVNYLEVDGVRAEAGMPPTCDPFQRDIDTAWTCRDGSPATCVPFSGAGAGAERPLVTSASTLDGRVGQSRRKNRRSIKSLSGDVLSNPNLSALLDSPADFADLVRESVRSRSSRGAGAPVIFAEELEVADLRLAHTGSYKPLGAALYATGLGSQQPISILSPDPSHERVSLDVRADRVVSPIPQLQTSSSQK